MKNRTTSAGLIALARAPGRTAFGDGDYDKDRLQTKGQWRCLKRITAVTAVFMLGKSEFRKWNPRMGLRRTSLPEGGRWGD